MHSALDRAGKATVAGFKYITHQQLTAIVRHELSKSNVCWAAGTVWVRTNCIPMGGPFSAQGANIHSVQRVYQHRGLFRQPGALTVSPEGFPLWEGRWGRVAMCQFRDNILIATDCPEAKQAALIENIRTIVKIAWGLEVECDCITPQQNKCTRCCCGPVRKAVGVVMTLCPQGRDVPSVNQRRLNLIGPSA